MSITVEHDKRKYEILSKAFEVFLEEGFANATFQKIADRCNITRTTLYIYFKNKTEIFLFSIKQMTDNMESALLKVLENKKHSAKECLNITIDLLMDGIEKNKQLFIVLLPYLIDLQKKGDDPKKRVMRRIIRLRHFLSTIIIRGQNNGEFKKIPIGEINDLIFDLIQSAIFRVVIFAEKDVSSVRHTLKLAVREFCV